jgi:hypothetical protein
MHAALDACSVVIIDLKLLDERESEQARARSGLLPSDGLALKEVLSSWLARRALLHTNSTDGAPIDIQPHKTAFVVYSGELERMSGRSPVFGREHVIARQARVEWVMSKLEAQRPAPQRKLMSLLELAAAVEAIRRVEWISLSERQGILGAVGSLMGLREGDDWFEHALRMAVEFRPPIQSLGSGDGMSLLRWLLHIVLPFPSFLVDASEVGLLLRVDPGWCYGELDSSSPLRAVLSEFEYRGVLAKFLGRRWWRAGVIEKVRSTLGPLRHQSTALAQEVATWARVDADVLPVIREPIPVRVVDPEFRLTGEVIDASCAVRLDPEDWPEPLARPWISIDVVREHPTLVRYVVASDLERVVPSDGPIA